MRITVNGEPRDVDECTTVAALLDRLHRERTDNCEAGVRSKLGTASAIEVNRTLVPRRQHTDRILADGDVVEIVTLVGGG